MQSTNTFIFKHLIALKNITVRNSDGNVRDYHPKQTRFFVEPAVAEILLKNKAAREFDEEYDNPPTNPSLLKRNPTQKTHRS
jgi:hypothetical protein